MFCLVYILKKRFVIWLRLLSRATDERYQVQNRYWALKFFFFIYFKFGWIKAQKRVCYFRNLLLLLSCTYWDNCLLLLSHWNWKELWFLQLAIARRELNWNVKRLKGKKIAILLLALHSVKTNWKIRFFFFVDTSI